MDEYHQIKDTNYYINKLGSFKHIFKNGNITYLKNHKNKVNGYIYVSFKQKTSSLHRLLALQFIPNPENKPCVDHINTIRDDNRLENLRWATVSENARNTLRKNKGCIFTRKDKFKKKDGSIKVYISYRFQWFPEYNKKKGKTFKTKQEAEDFQKSIYPPQSVVIDQ